MRTFKVCIPCLTEKQWEILSEFLLQQGYKSEDIDKIDNDSFDKYFGHLKKIAIRTTEE